MDVDLDIVRVSVSVTLLFLVIVGNVRLLVYCQRTLPNNNTLKNVLPVLCVSSFLAGVSGLSGVLMSAWKDGPLQGTLSCEVFATFDHVFAGGANWMLAVIAMERYLYVRAPAEHSSTFSVRNLKILAAGLYILQIMMAVGPFYGLGEYSVFRGKLSLFVTLNVTSVPAGDDTCTLETLMSTLRGTYFQLMPKRVPDPVFVTAHYLTTVHHVIVARSRWVDDGMLFLMRMPNATVLDAFWEEYTSGSVGQTISSVVYSKPVVDILGPNIPEVVCVMDPSDYSMLRESYLPSQEMGVCAGDFTSVNQHSDIWMAYNVLLTALLPCAIALFCCSAICVRQFRLGVDAVKSSIPDDLFFIKALTVVSWLSFGTHLAFIVINIMFARGTHFTPTTLLSMTYLVHINRLSLYIIWCLVDGTPFIAIRGIGRNILRMCTTVNGVFKSESNTSRSFNSQAATPVSV
ncbi:uncharacterized protein [Haliotis cracherodii]|uniref:uncharacterized protein n=1 Tax=Haliotis cracherodii TaxID=6455 RepID=UPI0039E865EC